MDASNDYDLAWEPGLPVPEYHGALPEPAVKGPERKGRGEKLTLVGVMLLLTLGLGLTYAKATSKPVEPVDEAGLTGAQWDELQNGVIHALLQRVDELERRQLSLQNYFLGFSESEWPVAPRVNQPREFQPPRSTTHPPRLPDYPMEIRP